MSFNPNHAIERFLLHGDLQSFTRKEILVKCFIHCQLSIVNCPLIRTFPFSIFINFLLGFSIASSMNQSISVRLHFLPFNLRMSLHEIFWQAVRCFSKHHDIPVDGVSGFTVVKICFINHPTAEFKDSIYGIQHIYYQHFRVVFRH